MSTDINIVPSSISSSFSNFSSQNENLTENLLHTIFTLKKNVFITGSGGTGKSYCAKEIKALAEKKNIVMILTATTGVAALNIKGTTIHRFGGIKVGKESVLTICQKIRNYNKDCYKSWKETNILFIDEVSMLPAKILNLLNDVAKNIRDNDLPFGGMQVIVSGDFCFSGNTPIMLLNGSIKNAKDIIIGDVLMGDDSTPRIVEKLFTGKAKMYNVYINKEFFTVTGNHILCFHLRRNILWNSPSKSYIVQYWNNKTLNKMIFPIFIYKTKENALIEATKYSKTFDSNQVIELSVINYLNLTEKTQHELVGYKVGVTYSEKKLLMDPWLLGSIISESNKKNDDDYLLEQEKQLNIQNNNITLLDNYIPDNYLYNSRKNRLKLLAGLIDSRGILYNNLFQIDYYDKNMANQVCCLARSLGLICFIESSIKTNRCYIKGNIHEIPCIIKTKQVPKIENNINYLNMKIKVVPVEEDNFYGFQTNENKRFLLKNFTVVHNCQLPPVMEEFSFFSDTWEELDFQPFRFNKPYRFDNIDHFDMLQRIRIGKLLPEDIKILKTRVTAYIDFIRKGGDKNNKIKITRIYNIKKDAEACNFNELEKLPGDIIEYNAIDKFNVKKKKGKKEDENKPSKKLELSKKEQTEYSDFFDTMVPRQVFLKAGAQVMLTYNLDVNSGLVNGSRGVIINCENDGVNVLFEMGDTIKIKFYDFEFEDNKVTMIRYQIPLMLASALTVHKLQGITLTTAIIDLGPSVFLAGQAYVALSRVKTLEGILLSSFMSQKVYADDDALEFEKTLEYKE